MRTGWDPDHRNGVTIARMAEDIGIQALAVHGRTRACMYKGDAEYETIRAIKQSVAIPIFANGDIDSPHKAKLVLEQTGADGLMVGRNAQGRPWIFREIEEFLRTSCIAPEPSLAEVRDIMRAHLRDLHAFYGEEAGVRVARKHIDWYARGRAAGHALRHAVMQAEDAQTQLACAGAYFEALETGELYGVEKKNESSSRADREACVARAAAADDDRRGPRVLLRDLERAQARPAV
jgi:tRNA-dihydrouridine synthase B